MITNSTDIPYICCTAFTVGPQPHSVQFTGKFRRKTTPQRRRERWGFQRGLLTRYSENRLLGQFKISRVLYGFGLQRLQTEQSSGLSGVTSVGIVGGK